MQYLKLNILKLFAYLQLVCFGFLFKKNKTKTQTKTKTFDVTKPGVRPT